MTTATRPKQKNLYAKTVKIDKPYEVWMSSDGTWVWLVLKKWQVDDYAPYARAFCAVYSPMTFGSYDLGDTYLAEIRKNAFQIDDDPTIRRVLLNLHIGKPVELSLAAAEKVVGHKLTLTKVAA